MTNQLLFGEAVEILREKGALWLKVRSLHDGYEGWMTRNLVEEVDELSARLEVSAFTKDHISVIQVRDMTMRLPMGSCLPGWEHGKGQFGTVAYRYEGEVHMPAPEGQAAGQLETRARDWINAPYLWGGRTLLGVDCSGFAQVQFRMLGIELPRDAWQQAQEGQPVKKLRDAQKADLAFFDDKDEIVHVGILLSSEEIIHASGRVRIDKIDKKGIIQPDTGKRTHSLRAIRRIL